MPPLPARHLLATALLGDQESIESVLLAEIFSSGGSRNLSIDKNGRVQQILGYLRQNAAAITSNTGAVAQRLRGLYHYVSQSGGAATRQELGIFTDDAAHWEFRVSNDIGVTWTFKFDYGVTSANKIPFFSGSGNLTFLTNGVIPPAQWDGANLTTAGSVQLAAPTFVSTGAGNLGPGNVAFRILPMVGNTRKLSSVQSINYSVTAATGAGNVAWAADPDVTVTGYEIYRTTGSGQIFYREGYVDGRLTVIFGVGGAGDTDALVIANRVLAEFGDAPPIGAYICFNHKQRLWYLRTDANPRTAYYSDPGVPYSCYLAFNKIDFTDAESFTDVATGGVGEFLGMGVIFLERSIWTVSGTGTIIGTNRDFVRLRRNAQTGSVSGRTVVRIPAGAAFTDANGEAKKTPQVMLAYLTPLLDVRLFDGDNDEIISYPKARTLSTMNYAARNKAFAIHDRFRQEVAWVYADGASDEPSIAVVWNYRWGTWYTRDWPFACGIEIETPNAASVLLAGEGSKAIGAFCYKLWTGYTFNGANINAQWETAVLYGKGFFGDPTGLYGKPLVSHRKRWRWADFLFDVVGGQVTLTIEWILGDNPADSTVAFASRTVTIPTETIETSDGSVLESLDLSMLMVQTAPALLRARLQKSDGRYAHSRGIRLRIKTSTSSAQWSLSAIDIMYQLLTGEKRTVGSIT